MNSTNNSIIAVAPDGIGRAVLADIGSRDIFKSNGKEDVTTGVVRKRKSRWEDDSIAPSKPRTQLVHRAGTI